MLEWVIFRQPRNGIKLPAVYIVVFNMLVCLYSCMYFCQSCRLPMYATNICHHCHVSKFTAIVFVRCLSPLSATDVYYHLQPPTSTTTVYHHVCNRRVPPLSFTDVYYHCQKRTFTTIVRHRRLLPLSTTEFFCNMSAIDV